MSAQTTLKQVREFIDAGRVRRQDNSAQVLFTVKRENAKIEARTDLTPDQKADLVEKLDGQVKALIRHFVPAWVYPPVPFVPGTPAPDVEDTI